MLMLKYGHGFFYYVKNVYFILFLSKIKSYLNYIEFFKIIRTLKHHMSFDFVLAIEMTQICCFYDAIIKNECNECIDNSHLGNPQKCIKIQCSVARSSAIKPLHKQQPRCDYIKVGGKRVQIRMMLPVKFMEVLLNDSLTVPVQNQKKSRPFNTLKPGYQRGCGHTQVLSQFAHMTYLLKD